MCTGIRLVAENGSPVFGRTMEFGADLLSFNLIVVPRGTQFQGFTSDGDDGAIWQVKYGFAAGIPYDYAWGAAEGLNEAGLQAGAFFFEPFERAAYMDEVVGEKERTIASMQVVTWVLSTCDTVECVKQQLPTVRVVGAMPQQRQEGWDYNPSLHFAINDAKGDSIVVEYVDGQLTIHDNPLGTIANAPNFEWHQQNLKQYTRLPVDQVPPIERDEAEKGPTGLDINVKTNLPGEITSPNRFVRAAIFSQYALPMNNAQEGVQRVLNILHNFDIPYGYKLYRHANGKEYPQYTQWISVSDLENRRLYFRAFSDPQLKVVDLKNFDLSSGELMKIPVANEWHPVEILPSAQ